MVGLFQLDIKDAVTALDVDLVFSRQPADRESRVTIA